MMNRNVQFWDAVANHPEVSPHIFLGEDQVTLAPLVLNERNMPLASENGGVIFTPLDGFGMVMEMHTLYRPEGWGREVAINGKAFIHQIMQTSSIIVTHEQENNWRSKPPKSHGWKETGDYCYVGLSKRLKLWLLTREAWLASPVGRKMQCPQ